VETVVQNLKKNIAIAKGLIQEVVPEISKKRTCLCATALKDAIMTEPQVIPPDTREKLELLVGKYLKK
jgi:5'-methylthioadenosine phosphorylase